jgi:hypothetical protein
MIGDDFWLINLDDGSLSFLASIEDVATFMLGRDSSRYLLYRRMEWPECSDWKAMRRGLRKQQAAMLPPGES